VANIPCGESVSTEVKPNFSGGGFAWSLCQSRTRPQHRMGPSAGFRGGGRAGEIPRGAAGGGHPCGFAAATHLPLPLGKLSCDNFDRARTPLPWGDLGAKFTSARRSVQEEAEPQAEPTKSGQAEIRHTDGNLREAITP